MYFISYGYSHIQYSKLKQWKWKVNRKTENTVEENFNTLEHVRLDKLFTKP